MRGKLPARPLHKRIPVPLNAFYPPIPSAFPFRDWVLSIPRFHEPSLLTAHRVDKPIVAISAQAEVRAEPNARDTPGAGIAYLPGCAVIDLRSVQQRDHHVAGQQGVPDGLSPRSQSPIMPAMNTALFEEVWHGTVQ